MVNLAWYIGIGVNVIIAISTIILILTTAKKQAGRPLSWWKHANGYLALVGLAITTLGTLLLYLQMGLLQDNLTEADTFLPPLLWIGYYITSVSFLGITLDQTNILPIRRNIIYALSIVVFSASGAGLLSYTIYWNDGAVIVLFSNFIADMVGTGLAICIALIAFSVSFTRRIEIVNRNDELNGNDSSKGIYLLTASTVYLMTFVVPRASTESIINPVTVKIIGILIFVTFAIALAKYLIVSPVEKQDKASTGPDLESLLRSSDEYLIGGAVLITFLYVIVSRIDFPILTVAEKNSIGWPIYYLGIWNGNQVYADPIGCLLPLLVAIVVVPLVIILLKAGKPSRLGIALLGINAITSFSLSTADVFLTRQGAIVESPTASVFPFVVGPLLAWFILSVWNQKKNVNTEIIHETSSKSLFALSLSIFSINVVSALVFDILTAVSPYQIIHLGGGIISDGLIWAPALSNCVFLVFIVMSNILKVGISGNALWKGGN